jgi:GNAT superfamily N-acetyltransferase
MTSRTVVVRRAAIDDVEAAHELILAIARHHDQAQHVHITPERMRADGFGADPRFGILLAEVDGEIAGYASYAANYSIWLGGHYMNIDDVFVWERFRGLRVGEALMHEARAVCVALGMPRLRWEVQPDNAGAIRFYERLGAVMRTKGVFGWNA